MTNITMMNISGGSVNQSHDGVLQQYISTTEVCKIKYILVTLSDKLHFIYIEKLLQPSFSLLRATSWSLL